MSRFGFDPSIGQAALRENHPSINETMQTLGQLASQRTQQRQGDAQLADLLRKQQQEQTLAGIYRGNADTPEGLSAALMRGGFGPQAFAAEDQTAQMGMQRAQQAKLKAEAETAYRKHIAEHFYNTTNEADYQARVQDLASSRDPMLATFAAQMPKYDPAYVKRLGDSAMSPKERAELEDKSLGRTETGRHNREMEKRPAPMLMFGSGGEQYVGDLRRPNTPAAPVMGPNGEQLVKPPAAGAAGGGKEWKDLTQAVSTGARGSLAKDLQKSINSAEGIEALLKLPNGQLINATPQQMHEAYTALNNLISKGGSQAASQIDALVPETLASKWANIKQKVLNEPQGADAKAFIENVLDTTHREAALATKQLRRQQLQSIPNYAHLRGADKKRFDSILKGAGLDPASIDDSGLEATAATGAVVKKEFSKSRNQTRLTYADGRQEVVDGQR